MNYKLVCWKGMAIPVDEDFNWMAFDEDGLCYAYKNEPVIEGDQWNLNEYMGAATLCEVEIPPPKPGDWKTQLYDIS